MEEFIVKMAITEKIKTINYKIEQNKAPYDLDHYYLAAKISVFSSRNASRCGFLIGEYVFSEKYFLDKAGAMKGFDYSPLGKKQKGQMTNWHL